MKTLTLIAALLAAPLAACSKGDAPAEAAPKHELKSMTVDEVAAKLALKDGKTFVFDNNVEDAFKQSHVPGAKWLDPYEVTAAKLPADKNALLIFYCHNET
jgi:hypothetical protein